MSNDFLNTHITPIKKYDGKIKGKKIVVLRKKLILNLIVKSTNICKTTNRCSII